MTRKDEEAGNGGSVPRTGTIAVAGQVFSVTQGVGCTFTIAPTSEHAASGGGDAGVDVTAPVGCAWTAQSLASWIFVTSGGTGGGSGRLAYAVATNTGHGARTGTILVAGRTFTVNQDGAPTNCSYSISPSKRRIGAAGGTGAVSIKTSNGCTWSAQGPVGWITITSAGGGAGSGTLTYAVAPNTSGVARQGTLIIAGRTFTVPQSR